MIVYITFATEGLFMRVPFPAAITTTASLASIDLLFYPDVDVVNEAGCAKPRRKRHEERPPRVKRGKGLEGFRVGD